MKLTIAARAIFGALLLSATSIQGNPADGDSSNTQTVITVDTVPNPNEGTGKVRVYVEFAPGKAQEVKQALQTEGGEIHYEFDALRSFAVTVPEGRLNSFEKNPNVVKWEPDPLQYSVRLHEPESATVHGAPNWHPERKLAEQIPYGVNAVQAPDAWAAGYTGSGVKVCVIDSGYDNSHADLPDLDQGTQGENPSGGEPWYQDQCKHGTHVTGTIAAIRNNGIGVPGVAPDVELFIMKVFAGTSCGWVYSSTVLNAAERCAAAGANIINMSLSGGFSSTQRDGFQALFDQGVISVAAAGNGGSSAIAYPAGYPAVVSCAAVDSNNNRASFSQYNDDVELSGPGVAVLSTLPGSTYGSYSGTSMATPHVAAVTALVWSSKPTATPTEVLEALRNTALDLGAPGRDIYYGYGLVQAKDAIDSLLGGDPPAPDCIVAADCGISNGCITYSCNAGVCLSSEAFPGCQTCNLPGDCNDNNECTLDVCNSAGQCENIPISGCTPVTCPIAGEVCSLKSCQATSGCSGKPECCCCAGLSCSGKGKWGTCR
jgi:Subtilase family